MISGLVSVIRYCKLPTGRCYDGEDLRIKEAEEYRAARLSAERFSAPTPITS